MPRLVDHHLDRTVRDAGVTERKGIQIEAPSMVCINEAGPIGYVVSTFYGKPVIS